MYIDIEVGDIDDVTDEVRSVSLEMTHHESGRASGGCLRQHDIWEQ